MGNLGIRNQYRTANNIFQLLDMLKSREIVGNLAVSTVCQFVTANKTYEALIYSIIDKKLKTRCGVATINKVFTALVPEFPVALAENLNDIPESHVDLERDVWIAMRKFDGVRVICIIRGGVAEFRSREGKVFVTLQVILPHVNSLENLFPDLNAFRYWRISSMVSRFKLIKRNFTSFANSECRKISFWMASSAYSTVTRRTSKRFFC